MKTALLVLILFATLACRKKINHVVGETSTYNNGDTLIQGGPAVSSLNWTKITDDEIKEVFSVENFNGELYLGGAFQNGFGTIRCFGKLNSQGILTSPLVSNFSTGTVYDVYTYNNELIVGGNFTINNTGGIYDLIRITSTGQVIDIPFSTSTAHSVRRMIEYNGDLVVGGIFSPSSTNSVLNYDVDILTNYSPSSGITNFSLNGPITGLVVHNGELYACGKNAKLYKRSGGTWLDVPYIGQNAFVDKIHGIAIYNSELYILGNFENSYYVKKMNTQGIWENIPQIYQLGDFSQYSGIKTVGDKLFIFGNGFKFEYGSTSGIMSFDGTNWSKMNSFPYEVRDVEFFNNHYYIASNYGLYKYE